MRKVAPILVLRLALLVAVFGCAVLVVEYKNAGDSAFCGVGSGCETIRRSAYSHLILNDSVDLPLPVLGLCLQAGLLALALVAKERSQTFFVAVAAAAGGVVGLGLLALQAFVLDAFCRWCVLVDVSAIVAAVAAALVHLATVRSAEYAAFVAALEARRAQIVAWGVGAAAVVGLPFLWAEYPVVPPLPPAIAALAVPGKVTIVAFTDFECPYCRKLSPVLHDVQENWGDRAALVRKMAPLSIHAGALPAALAYVCTPEPQREEMARVLYAAPAPVLTLDGVRVLARELHLDDARFGQCLEGSAARATVAADRALFDSVGAHGLPHTFIGSRSVAGYNPDAVRAIGHEAMNGNPIGLPLGWMVIAAFLVAVALALVTLGHAPRDPEATLAPAP